MKYYEKHKPTIANYQEFILLETEQQHFPSEGLYDVGFKNFSGTGIDG